MNLQLWRGIFNPWSFHIWRTLPPQWGEVMPLRASKYFLFCVWSSSFSFFSCAISKWSDKILFWCRYLLIQYEIRLTSAHLALISAQMLSKHTPWWKLSTPRFNVWCKAYSWVSSLKNWLQHDGEDQLPRYLLVALLTCSHQCYLACLVE